MKPVLVVSLCVALAASDGVLVWLGVSLQQYHPREAGACWLLAAVDFLALAGIGLVSAASVEALSLPPVRRASNRARASTTPRSP
ncbi:hypothetical protein LXT21_29575 [Myxococcus sp. K38C18041901]|uniref:hypothetical protein n=1 Tax=Myxococcus guangdongensis TaxID=2906760 RepID=UPI0020A80F15|nr:hypothetical protein [Myxococcus guangdongensis]MCP3062942.1 hypothetical protein [Myxococcus guangdongensis]